ncbi:MAG: NAD(P)/FAD-dependent oxidoreductase [Oscillospiraceae bacterium]|jgi:thioredoxin reductase (NADPH)|nr:NAD(P)/FAD-dependent oxidoreductase [Oscillospiraceae bacterium]
MEQINALIIGFGPAGCSAALYLRRAGLSVALVGKDSGALERAEKIENYFGLPQPMSGKELVEVGKQQCLALGAKLWTDEAISLEWQEDGGFAARFASGREAKCQAILLATGKSKKSPDIEGLHHLEGRGVSYCAVCDAFLYRGRSVAVLGSGIYALHEMEELLPLAERVFLLTNGETPEISPPEGVLLHTEHILRLEGDNTLRGALLEDENALEFQGLFVALGSASASDLARKLGVQLRSEDQSAILVNAQQETTLPGLFAAGDCTGSFAQVSLAVAEGARAALAMIPFIRGQKK